jgi:transglutaminase-like putative cysteine protease
LLQLEDEEPLTLQNLTGKTFVASSIYPNSESFQIPTSAYSSPWAPILAGLVLHFEVFSAESLRARYDISAFFLQIPVDSRSISVKHT